MRVRRSILFLLLLVAVLPAAIFAVRANQQQAADVPLNLQTLIVARGDVEVTVNAIGTIGADQVVSVQFLQAGRVTEVPFQLGDRVVAGDVLARQVDDAQRLAVEQARLGVRVAELQKARLTAGPDDSQIRIAQANVAAAEGAVASIASAVSPEQIRAAELSVQSADQAVTDARAARATASGDQAPEAYALLDARIGQAEFQAEIAREQLAALRGSTGGQIGAAQARVTQAEAEAARLLAPPTQAQLDQADAQIANQQLTLERAERALAQMRLIAPFDGVLSALNVEVGALSAPGVPAAEITDTDPLRLTVQVDEIDVRQIREGQAARVRLDALPGVLLAATIERIALIGTNVGGIVSYDVRVRLDDTDPRVRVGMTAEAEVVVEQRADVVIVPNAYIRLDRAADRAYVNRLDAAGALEEVEVSLGLQGGESSEITAGVREGDTVAVDLSGDAIGLFGG